MPTCLRRSLSVLDSGATGYPGYLSGSSGLHTHIPGLRDDVSVVAAIRQQKGDLGIIQAEQFADRGLGEMWSRWVPTRNTGTRIALQRDSMPFRS